MKYGRTNQHIVRGVVENICKRWYNSTKPQAVISKKSYSILELLPELVCLPTKIGQLEPLTRLCAKRTRTVNISFLAQPGRRFNE